MDIWFQRTYLQIKNMGILFFIPFIGYFIIIPLFSYVDMDLDMDWIERLTEICYIFIPVLSVFWTYLQFQSQLEEEAREVCFVYGGIGIQTFLFYMMNVVCFLPLLFMEDTDGRLMGLFMQMAIISFLLHGLAMFLSFTLKNISLSVFIIILYHFISIRYQEFWKTIRYGMMSGDTEWLQAGSRFFFAGVIFWILGVMSTKRL